MSGLSERQFALAKRWLKRQFPTLVTGVLFILLWEGIARAIGNNRIVADIGYTISSLQAQADTIVVRVSETFSSVVVAFILAVVLGVLLGMVIAEIYTLRQMTMPLIIFAYAVPHPVLAPMFIIWFLVGGSFTLFTFTGPSAYIFPAMTAADAQIAIGINGVSTFGAWVGFFPVFISTITGMNELEERYQHLGTVLGATRWQMVKYFRFWRALPNIASSIKSTVQLSIVGVIVAEFIASSSGIGYQIILAWKTGDLGYMFGVVLVIMLVSYTFFQLAVWTVKYLTPPGSTA
ncbi:ABC transporter permease subunit [Haloarcula sp. S1AR25-5A]|uniref:ABC transporter permease subunit n=1 Tax=Haloarcula terrestris TaxID=2950533 RepID=A0AAE4F0N4_9EURY|nr:ABC transporter permease subunit [Haloarcula terrestris]MDS0222343.1 ABC transporter permease subunit [Haloarcula terrestris]